MKYRLKILAWSHIVFGGAGLGALAALLLAYAMARDPAYDDEFAFFAGGIGILRRIPWARWILWIEAGLLALAIPVGHGAGGPQPVGVDHHAR